MNSNAIRQWVADRTGLTAIWLHPDAPRPDRPYATVRVLADVKIGRASTSQINALGEAHVAGQRETTLSVQVIESADALDPRAAFDRLAALRDSLDLYSVRRGLADGGWAFVRVETLQDIPSVVGTTWEPRAVFDVVFRRTVTQTDDLGFVETVDLTGTIDGEEYSDTISVEDA